MNTSTSEKSENMAEIDIKYLSHKSLKRKNKSFDDENHTVVVSEQRKVKIKHVRKGENLSKAHGGEILNMLPCHF